MTPSWHCFHTKWHKWHNDEENRSFASLHIELCVLMVSIWVQFSPFSILRNIAVVVDFCHKCFFSRHFLWWLRQIQVFRLYIYNNWKISLDFGFQPTFMFCHGIDEFTTIISNNNSLTIVHRRCINLLPRVFIVKFDVSINNACSANYLWAAASKWMLCISFDCHIRMFNRKIERYLVVHSPFD